MFSDRIRALDRRIMPGVSKLNWQSDKHTLEFYYKEARKHCRIADSCVAEFKAGMARIDALCKSIAEGLLIDVEKKKLYEYTEFEAVQAKHHSMVCRASCFASASCSYMHASVGPHLVHCTFIVTNASYAIPCSVCCHDVVEGVIAVVTVVCRQNSSWYPRSKKFRRH